jgi:hypothetical protein
MKKPTIELEIMNRTIKVIVSPTNSDSLLDPSFSGEGVVLKIGIFKNICICQNEFLFFKSF